MLCQAAVVGAASRGGGSAGVVPAAAAGGAARLLVARVGGGRGGEGGMGPLLRGAGLGSQRRLAPSRRRHGRLPGQFARAVHGVAPPKRGVSVRRTASHIRICRSINSSVQMTNLSPFDVFL